MSMINRLSIQGIRSFGEEKQKIEFNTPLTLIVGENGCGKTTVIECLKYALTGDVPPGSERGRNFVHDVKLLSKNISDAKVELTITDPKGVDKTVFRSMRVEMGKGGKTKFQTFDSTIRYAGGDVPQFTSGRVDDINNHMSESMGVSKAILNNVIFCHQEDSNWPLEEGKKLKEKFDAIFGTTKYNNGITKLTKNRKGYEEEWKQCKSNIKYLEEIKIQVERKERNITDLKKKLDDTKTKYDTFDVTLKPLEAKKEIIMKKELDYSKILNEKNDYESIIKNKQLERENLEKKIKKKLNGTKAQLEQELENFLENQRGKKDKLKSLESDNTKLQTDERDNQKSLVEVKNKAANCIEKMEKLQNLKSERFGKVKEMCKMVNVEFNHDLDQSANSQDISNTVESIKDNIKKKEETLQTTKSKALEDDVNYQKMIDKLRDERTKIETNLTSQKQSLEKFDEKAKEIKKQLADSEQSIPMLNKLKPKIEEYERKLKKLNDESNVDELRESHDILSADNVDYEDKLARLESDIEILQSASRITSELELKGNDLTKEQKDFDRIKNKLSSNFKNLFSKQSIESNFRSKVQSKREELEREVKSTKERSQNLQRECDRMQDQRNSLRNQQKQKDTEIRKIEADTEDVCNGREFPEYLASQKEKVEKLNLELAVKESSKNTYKSYITQIDESPCCPLCHKGLDNDESDNLKAEMMENIEVLPSKISIIRDNLKKETKIYDNVNGLKSAYDSLKKLQDEKSKIETDLKNLDTKLSAKNEELDNLVSVLAEPESLLNIITQSFFADCCKLDDLQRNITNKTKEVNALKEKLPKNIPEKSLSEAQTERKATADLIKANNEKMKEINDKINSYQTELMNTREQLNNLNTKKNEYQKLAQQIEDLKEKLKQITIDKQNLEVEIKNNKSKLTPTIEELNSLTLEKQSSHQSQQNKIEIEQDTLNKLKLDQSEMERLDKEIIGYENMCLENTLKRLNSNTEKLKATEKSIRENLSKVSKEIQELRDFLANEETTKRNIIDNIDILKIDDDKKEAENNLQQLKKQMGELDLEKMKIEKKNVLMEIQKIYHERTKLSGQEDELKNQLESFENELNDKKFRGAKENYTKELCREQVLGAVISDIKKYTAALEKALLKYHQEKMDQINQIMKELWNSIYQGNDIDSIMIKTDEEEAATSTTEKSRRSYNYRVVQVKNGTEIDMRGRCSAGQKVLASLIIRIALADTFSSSCGILALDEPTTNLDHNNIASLSSALGQLVAERDNGRFMLIIITHDETFVRSLERAENYWKLSRDTNGNSVIEEFRNY